MFKKPKDLIKANKIFKKNSGKNYHQRLCYQTMEECAELQMAILHKFRDRATDEDVMSEVSDVFICLDSLVEEFGGYKKLNKILKQKSAKYLHQMKTGVK